MADPRLQEPASQSPEYQACPVCQGRGTVPNDFYDQLGAGTSTAREQCRTCRGRTVIQRPDDERIEILRAMTVNPRRNAHRALLRLDGEAEGDPREFLQEAVDQLEALYRQALEWAA